MVKYCKVNGYNLSIANLDGDYLKTYFNSFNMGSTISAVKNIAHTIWQGIKIATKYIIKAVLLPIVEKILKIFIYSIKAVMILVSKYINLDISDISNGLLITLHKQQLKFSFTIGDQISLSNLILMII